MAKLRTIRFLDLLVDSETVKEITIDITEGQFFSDKEEVHYNQDIELEDIEVVEAFTTNESTEFEDDEIEESDYELLIEED